MPKYEVVSQSTGSFELQGIPIIWDTGSAITRTPVVGDDYYDPNTGQVSNLYGQTKYQPITITAVLTVNEYKALDALYTSGKAFDGTLTATHKIGKLTRLLTGIQLGEMSDGEFNKLSNSPAKISLQVSYSGLRTV
ncbi:MAG: hypothetical protein F6K28_40735 [Microcoleus sp. SIO2G3]|nr:hypothetical protein [Microcoleus sp. SIO2G3]